MCVCVMITWKEIVRCQMMAFLMLYIDYSACLCDMHVCVCVM